MPLYFSAGYTKARILSVNLRGLTAAHVHRVHEAIDLGGFLNYQGKWPPAADRVIPLHPLLTQLDIGAVAEAYTASKPGIYIFRSPILTGIAYNGAESFRFRERLHLNYAFCLGRGQGYCRTKLNYIAENS